MSFANPTPLRVGAQGTLHGWSVRVVGRVVMGMEADDGETYYWHEYNLVDAAGTGGTLVYEETENGPEWKLFTAFEPHHALSAREAAAKRVGDTVNLDGRPVRVSLVDESRVHHIEGTPPEGVQVGDVARYFNADAGDRMLVVSWTGNEIEFYEGRDLRPDEVAAAFGFTAAGRLSPAAALRGGTSASRSRSTTYFTVVAVLLTFATAIGVYSCVRRPAAREPAPGRPQPPPAARLATGAQGRLQDQHFRVASQALVQIGRVGGDRQRREYRLSRDGAEPALLVQGLTGTPREWHLLLPVPTPDALGSLPPYDVAALRKGATVPGFDAPFQLVELFVTRRLATEGDGGPAAWPDLRYGWVARHGDEWLLARWTETTLEIHRGRALPEAAVLAAFGAAGAKK